MLVFATPVLLTGCTENTVFFTVQNLTSESIETLSVDVGNQKLQFKHIAARSSVSDQYSADSDLPVNIDVQFSSGKTQHKHLAMLGTGPRYSHSFSITDTAIELTNTSVIGGRL